VCVKEGRREGGKEGRREEGKEGVCKGGKESEKRKLEREGELLREGERALAYTIAY